ncbi:MAG: signal peptide peptidase SppA [Planctomycetota bacterium]
MPSDFPADSSANAPAPANAGPPQPIVIQQRESLFGRLGKFLVFALVVCIAIIAGLSAKYQSYFNEPTGPQEKYHSLSKTATDKVAILSVTGAIMETDNFAKKQIDRIRKDESVKAIVLRVNSPGGTVTYSDYLLHHLNKLAEERELPVVVSMGSVCASGGYYVAMAVGDQPDTIFAEPTTWTGSIGVIIPHYDFSGAMQNMLFKIRDDSIASGKFKQMGSPTRRMTDEEVALFQEMVDLSYEGFLEKVRAGRPALAETPDKLAEITQGQIFTAGQAVENGLVDKIGFVEDAVDRALELAGLTAESARCVRYAKPVGPLDSLLSARPAQPEPPAATLRSLIDFSTPRAYYLWSTLPSLLDRQ